MGCFINAPCKSPHRQHRRAALQTKYCGACETGEQPKRLERGPARNSFCRRKASWENSSIMNEIKVLLWLAAVKNPFDRDTFDSGHCLLDGLISQRSLEAHRHSRTQHRDISGRDAGMPHAAGGDLFHSGLGLGQSGHRSSFPDSEIPIFTSASGDCAALSFDNSGAERQTGGYGPHLPDWYSLLPDFSNPDDLTDSTSDDFACRWRGERREGESLRVSFQGVSDSLDREKHVTNITVAPPAKTGYASGKICDRGDRACEMCRCRHRTPTIKQAWGFRHTVKGAVGGAASMLPVFMGDVSQ